MHKMSSFLLTFRELTAVVVPSRSSCSSEDLPSFTMSISPSSLKQKTMYSSSAKRGSRCDAVDDDDNEVWSIGSPLILFAADIFRLPLPAPSNSRTMLPPDILGDLLHELSGWSSSKSKSTICSIRSTYTYV